MTWRKRNKWPASRESVWLFNGCNPWQRHKRHCKAVTRETYRQYPNIKWVRRMEIIHRAYNKGQP